MSNKSKLIYSNGDKYIGEFNKDGQPHGQGIHSYTNGGKYAGEFRNGMQYGRGIYTYPNGVTFTSEWKDDEPHGQGIYTFANGNEYFGKFKNDQPDRHGIQHAFLVEGAVVIQNRIDDNFKTYLPGKYIGEFNEDGQPHGQGIFTYSLGLKTDENHRPYMYTRDSKRGIKEGYYSHLEGHWSSLGDGSVGDGGFNRRVINGKRYITFETNKEVDNYYVYGGEWKNGKANGEFTMYFNTRDVHGSEQGYEYIGEMKDGVKHGQGTHDLYGVKTVGEFKNDRAHGQGIRTWDNDLEDKLVNPDDKYVGEFKNNKMDGEGTYTTTDGFKYVGSFNNDFRHGKGTATYVDGNTEGEGILSELVKEYCILEYSGEWAKNTWNGKGTLVFKERVKYIGGFKDGMRHGKGQMTYPRGDWRSDVFENDILQKEESVYTFKNGNKYIGNFDKDGKRHGPGTYTVTNGSSYVGEYKHGERHGQGTQIHSNGDVYVGEFENNIREGQGTQTYSDGAEYTGKWKDDLPVMEDGTYTYPNGSKKLKPKK